MSLASTALAAVALLVPQQAKKPSQAELDKLIGQYFRGGESERAQIRASLELCDPLSAADEKSWTKKLLKLSGDTGPKVASAARNYFYDEKAKKGLYLMGKMPGNGGLFFGLHGGGLGEGDASTAQGPWQGAVGSKGWVGVFPEVLEKTAAAWGDEPTEKFVLELIEAVKRTTKIDTNRIFLGGHSMGGYGTWTIGGRNADLFAGLCAFAGAATPYRDPGDKQTPVGIEEGILPNLRNVPIWVFHSRDDPRVDFPTNQFAVNELKKLGGQYGGYLYNFDAVDGKGHAFPDPKPPLDWVSKKARDPRPKKIVWQPFRPWKKMFYWLWWDVPQPNCIVVAEVTAPNQIDITIKDNKDAVERMSVLLDERLVDFDKDVVIRVNGSEKYHAKPQRSLAAMVLTAAERNDPEMLFTARVKLD